jgi:hypothetical protein
MLIGWPYPPGGTNATTRIHHAFWRSSGGVAAYGTARSNQIEYGRLACSLDWHQARMTPSRARRLVPLAKRCKQQGGWMERTSDCTTGSAGEIPPK